MLGFQTASKGKRAVFLDRDGVINEEIGYAHRLDELVLIKGSAKAIARLNRAGYCVIVVSNQAGIAYGYFTEDDMHTFNRGLEHELGKYGARIDAFYFCPHHAIKGTGRYRCACDCRKPNPGLLLRAAREHSINIGASFMVGDKWIDVEAGNRAGCASILVKTGHGKEELNAYSKRIERVAADLHEAVGHFIVDTLNE